MIRTHKLALEEIFEVLKVDTAAMAWLIEHCAAIFNKCQQGKDGRTPYERLWGKQFSGSMLEFGSQVMLKLDSRFTTLEHLVARKSDGVVVRTRAVRDFQKPPTVEDFAPQGVQRHRRLHVPRPEAVPEPEEHRLQHPIRVVPFLEQCTSPEPCWKGMVIPRDAHVATPCDVDRLTAQVVTLQIAADAWRLLWHKNEEYQFKVEQANFRKDQYFAEEVERSTERRETSEGSEEHVPGPDDQELLVGGTQGDQEMVMETHETKETSSSGEGGQRSAERSESSMQGEGVKRKADEELQEEREDASRTRSTEGGDELPITEASSSVSNGDGQVDMGGSRQSTQLQRPQDDEPAQEDQPPARHSLLEILCSLVHGNLDHGEDMRQEAKEIKQLIQAANGSFSLHILEEAASVEADHDATEWDNYWTPWWQKKGAEQVPPELTADQVLSAKKVEIGNIEERGVHEVVKREVMEQTPGATVLSVKWVLTNKGTPKAPIHLKPDL